MKNHLKVQFLKNPERYHWRVRLVILAPESQLLKVIEVAGGASEGKDRLDSVELLKTICMTCRESSAAHKAASKKILEILTAAILPATRYEEVKDILKKSGIILPLHGEPAQRNLHVAVERLCQEGIRGRNTLRKRLTFIREHFCCVAAIRFLVEQVTSSLKDLSVIENFIKRNFCHRENAPVTSSYSTALRIARRRREEIGKATS